MTYLYICRNCSFFEENNDKMAVSHIRKLNHSISIFYINDMKIIRKDGTYNIHNYRRWFGK